ncbi:uncharacterized protein STEHIDRAFT_172445 [Stereum hirsutum FP-91666 SS1]|uniref:uncharacterized protein n=1 Tax=Stereum hirsutum (strain FP-91666) TaxID=721885 RepID=UPI000444926B|nr:uncharacterized protein STEHIDRAFT_172445 [Stereum hirsutum FP-91666 SS1]EIM80723.1 hypothetical protein STEHIDRAFT_172445 [Stereum hirsutum FP-91666 SS1]
MASLAFTASSHSLVARGSSYQPSENTRQFVIETVANAKRFRSATRSVYTNPVQGSPGAYGYHRDRETPSPVHDTTDYNWLARSTPPLPLSPRQDHPSAVPLENLRNWCALTHSQWRDSEGRVLKYNAVQEAHVVSRSLNPDDKARLQVAWGLVPGDFDFDGPLNTIPLRANWHTLFDKKSWVLVPTRAMMGSIADAAEDVLFDQGARSAADASYPLLREDGKLIYKIYQYKIAPFGRSIPSDLIRMQFKKGKQHVELDKKTQTVYKTTEFERWPTVSSTVHPFAIIWKAVTEFGIDTELNQLHVAEHIPLMMQLREIYKRWMKYADDHSHLLLPEQLDRDPSPPSNRGSRRSKKSSNRKRQRTDSDDGSVGDRPKKRTLPSKRDRNEPGEVDRVPSLVFPSSEFCSLSSYHLESPSLIDRPVRVAPEVEEDSDDDYEEHRPSALQPQRKFNIADWAKTASVQSESVMEAECPSDPNVSEQPRKPPRGPWKLWPPAYKLSGCVGSRLS